LADEILGGDPSSFNEDFHHQDEKKIEGWRSWKSAMFGQLLIKMRCHKGENWWEIAGFLCRNAMVPVSG
jgi:hypothetical protein